MFSLFWLYSLNPWLALFGEALQQLERSNLQLSDNSSQRKQKDSRIVGVSDQGVLNQPVNLNCVPLIPDGDAKRHKVYTGLGNWCPTSSLRDRSCIPCTEVLVVGGYKPGERGS